MYMISQNIHKNNSFFFKTLRQIQRRGHRCGTKQKNNLPEGSVFAADGMCMEIKRQNKGNTWTNFEFKEISDTDCLYEDRITMEVNS